MSAFKGSKCAVMVIFVVSDLLEDFWDCLPTKVAGQERTNSPLPGNFVLYLVGALMGNSGLVGNRHDLVSKATSGFSPVTMRLDSV